MNEKILSGLKKIRTGIQVVSEPIDRFDRLLNYKKDYPPLWIRQQVGSLNDFEGSGAEYIAYLKLLCGLQPGMNVLDIGCGCGLMCLKVNENPTLPEYLYPGAYVGVDISRRSIDWCRKHVGGNVAFEWLPTGVPTEIPYNDGVFDVILCKSLFTHLLPSEVIGYVTEIKRLLKSNGCCLATFFLLTSKRKGRYRFEDWDGECHFSTNRKSNSRAAVGYKEMWIYDILTAMGLKTETHYGSWRGTNNGLSFQDITIIRRMDALSELTSQARHVGSKPQEVRTE